MGIFQRQLCEFTRGGRTIALYLARWWQLKYLLFSPQQFLGRWTKFPMFLLCGGHAWSWYWTVYCLVLAECASYRLRVSLQQGHELMALERENPIWWAYFSKGWSNHQLAWGLCMIFRKHRGPIFLNLHEAGRSWTPITTMTKAGGLGVTSEKLTNWWLYIEGL